MNRDDDLFDGLEGETEMLDDLDINELEELEGTDEMDDEDNLGETNSHIEYEEEEEFDD